MSILRSIAKGFPVVQPMRAGEGGGTKGINPTERTSSSDVAQKKQVDHMRKAQESVKLGEKGSNFVNEVNRNADQVRLLLEQFRARRENPEGGDKTVNAQSLSDRRTVTNATESSNDAAQKSVQEVTRQQITQQTTEQAHVTAGKGSDGKRSVTA